MMEKCVQKKDIQKEQVLLSRVAILIPAYNEANHLPDVVVRCFAIPWKQVYRYTLTVLVAIGLASALWWLLMRTFFMDPRLTHVLCLVVVWLTFSFPMLRTWVFREDR